MTSHGPLHGGGLGALRARRVLGPLLAALFAVLPVRHVQAASEDEMRVHAAYVMNFVRYSRWPGADEGPLVIAVLGTAENADALRGLAERAGSINGRRLSVRRLPLASIPPAAPAARDALAAATAHSHVLYVGSSHRAWSRTVAAATAGRPVLTIGPGQAFVAAGGMFGLYLDRGHVRFAVNAPAIKASSVDVSARLLVLARPAGGD